MRDKKLINIAWREVEKFIDDWKKSPYKWDNERDIQVELAYRLKRAYGSQNNYKAEYRVCAIPGYKQVYSRVRCEPRVYYSDNNEDRCCCKPDIVVFKDLDNPKCPPDDLDWKQKKNCPILWVCEIKYNTEVTPTNNLVKIKTDWDLKKLQYLTKNKEAQAACWLILVRRKEVHKERRMTSGKIRKYYMVVSGGKLRSKK